MRSNIIHIDAISLPTDVSLKVAGAASKANATPPWAKAFAGEHSVAKVKGHSLEYTVPGQHSIKLRQDP